MIEIRHLNNEKRRTASFLSLFLGRGIKKLDLVQWKVGEKYTNSFSKNQYCKNKTNIPYCIALFSSTMSSCLEGIKQIKTLIFQKL